MQNFPPKPAPNARLKLTNRWFLLPLGLAILGGLALTVDLPVAQFLAKHNLPGDIHRFVALGETFGYGLTAFAILLVARVLDRTQVRAWAWAAMATFAAGFAANLGKICFSRVRPHALETHLSHDIASLLSIRETFLGWSPNFSWDSTLQSFPSGHAATAAGLALALAWLYPQGRWAFVGLAILACFQRLEAQAHYLSDVLCGATLGSAVATGILLWAERRMAATESPAIAGTIGNALPTVANKVG
jgi:membrane-associated phospholipid phosphatase